MKSKFEEIFGKIDTPTSEVDNINKLSKMMITLVCCLLGKKLISEQEAITILRSSELSDEEFLGFFTNL